MSVKNIRENMIRNNSKKPRDMNFQRVINIPPMETPKYDLNDSNCDIKTKPHIDTSEFEIIEIKKQNNISTKFTDKVVSEYDLSFKNITNEEEKKALNILVAAIKYVSTLSYKELELMYEQEEPPRFDFPKIEKKLAVCSIDPAPLTFGVALCLLGTGEPIAVDIRSFREECEQPDLGRKNLLSRIKQYVDCINCSYIFWIIEDQIAGKLERAKFEKTFTTYGEAQTVQYFTMGILNDNIQVVAPKAVKEYFNIGIEESINGKIVTQDQKRRQYYHNKTRAVELALEMITDNIRKDIRFLTNRDDPNILDAILNAKYYINRLKHIPSIREKEKYDLKVKNNPSLKKAKIELYD